MRMRTDGRPWYKEPWPWILMVGPVVVIIAGILTAWLAIKSNDGLVEDDYYKEGLAVNQRLKRDHKAGDLGLHADVTVAGLDLRIRLTANDTSPFPPILTARFIHPTRSGQDQTVILQAEGAGQYGGKLAATISGRWIITLEEPSGAWRLQGEWQSGAREGLRLGAGEKASTINQSVTGR